MKRYSDCPQTLRDFLAYHETIKGQSQLTISEYYLEGIEELSDDSFLEVICNRVEAEKVKKTILQMNEKYRDVLYYHFVIGLTVPETAKSLNQTIAATKKQLVRGKKMLLKMLGIEGVETNGNEQE